MSNDLQVIKELQDSGIELVEELQYREGDIGYVLENNKVTELRIKMKEIPEGISKLTNLKELDLSNNQMKEIPEGISKLTNLKWLCLERNQIKEIPESISKLTNLKWLYLERNQIKEIPESISKLTNLQSLSLGNNQIKGIPESISKLINLQWLSLENNQIKEIPESISKLTNLKLLSLFTNQIKEIPDSISKLINLESLFLGNNKFPKEIDVKDNPKEIIQYLLKYQKSEKKPMNEVKVLVVGDERVGKTSVIKRWIQDEFSDKQESTKGVDISKYPIHGRVDATADVSFLKKVFGVFSTKGESKRDVSISSTSIEDIKLNIWDFAGQQVTHTPHQYFMTEQSLYLLVLDAQVEDSKSYYTIKYWLDMIKSYAGSDVPIVVVVNKIDLNSGYRFDINRYKSEYENIIDEVIYLSSKDGGDSFGKLKSVVEGAILGLDSVKQPFPVDYHDIKSDLEELQKDYIDDRDYFDICEKRDVTDESEQRILLKVLNAMGTVVSYSDITNLDRTYVINPEWVTNAIYEIIRSDILKQNKGILKKSDLKNILDSSTYKSNQYSWIISLMEKFEVCFEYDKDGDTVLVPAVFENIQPDINFEDYKEGFRLRIEYEFLPKSVISKFIVRSKYLIKDKNYWRDGVVLEYKEVEAVIKADEVKNIIDIYLINDGNHSREFLNMIRHEFRAIGDGKLSFSEKIPLYMSEHKGQFVKYEILVKLEQKGIFTNHFGTPEPEEYDIRQLLNGYNPKEHFAKLDKMIVYLENNPNDENNRLLKAIKEAREGKNQSLFDEFGGIAGNLNNIHDWVQKSYGLGELFRGYLSGM